MFLNELNKLTFYKLYCIYTLSIFLFGVQKKLILLLVSTLLLTFTDLCLYKKS